MDNIGRISDRILERTTSYYHFLRKMSIEDVDYIPSNLIAEKLNIKPIQVRKDLETIGVIGKPKMGYRVNNLLKIIKDFLGWNSINKAIIIGCGNLGQSLLSYRDFKKYGLEIVAGFDINPEVVGNKNGNINIYHFSEIKNVITDKEPLLAILTVPEEVAQEVTEKLIQLNVTVIWNFVPVFLRVPKCVAVQQQDLAPFITTLLDKYEQIHKAEKK